MAFKAIGSSEYPPTWKPEVGGRIIGTVTKREIVSTQYGEKPVLTVDDEIQGEITVFAGSTVLKQVYEAVSVGDTLDLTYLGEVISESSGRTYRNFSALVDDGQ